MKFGVIGEPCIDYIHREGIETSRHFGGILYSVVSLAVIADKENDEIYPIMNLGSDEFVSVMSFLGKFSNIKTDFVYRSSHKTRVVNLYYKKGASAPECGNSVHHKKTYDREENSTEPTLPISVEQLGMPSKMLDSILVNMISGCDIHLDTLVSMRKNFMGYIHMDLHNVVMQTDKDGSRTQKPVKKWLHWSLNCDTLQMNESEISILTGDNSGEKATAEKILSNGNVRSVIVTRGKTGVSLYEMIPELERKDFSSVTAENFNDSTGCGDVFASAFFYKMSTTRMDDVNGSVIYANNLASRKSELIGVEELYKLGE